MFTATEYMLLYKIIAHRQSGVGCLDFVLAPLRQALPGRELCIVTTSDMGCCLLIGIGAKIDLG